MPRNFKQEYKTQVDRGEHETPHGTSTGKTQA
jgi:hypothetical protein